MRGKGPAFGLHAQRFQLGPQDLKTMSHDLQRRLLMTPEPEHPTLLKYPVMIHPKGTNRYLPLLTARA